MKLVIACVPIAASLFVAAAVARAGVVVSTSADAPGWSLSFPVLQTTSNPQASMTVNQQLNAGNSYVQTFRTGPVGFVLDMLEIYSGGKAGGTARLNIYPDPVGGEDADGSVNTSSSTDLLNGGQGVEFTFPGSAGLQYVRLDLTGTDQVRLAPNQQYAIEIDVLSGQLSWQRSAAGTYPNGNLYVGGTEAGFDGTPPANNRGLRTQVGATPQRDGGMALFQLLPEYGDFNRDGVVDGADYVRWRKDFAGFGDGYYQWRAFFGETISGSGSGEIGSAELQPPAVPEPTTLVLMVAALAAPCRRLRKLPQD